MQKIALVVDDSRVARMTLSKLLVSHSFEVIELASGEQAISHLQIMATKPDIIFMDVMMGGMDGLTATRQIKSNNSLSAIPVVICTGNDSETDKEKALATGAMSVLSKPPLIEELDAILTNLEAPIHREIPQVESIVSPVNDDEIISKVMAAIEQNLVPKLHQELRDMTEQIVTNKVASQVDSLIPNISEKVVSQSKTVTETLAQQIATQTAQQAVQSSIADIDISTQVSQTLSSEGVAWLKHQQQKIHEELSENLQQTIASSIQQNLQTELEPLVTPLVSDQINKHLAQQMVDDEQVIKTLSKKVSRLKGVVIVLGIIVVALAAITLAPQLNLLYMK